MEERPPTHRRSRPPGIELMRLSWRHGRLLGAVVGVGVLASFLFTAPWLVAPQYRSEVVLYPAGTTTSTGLLNSEVRFGAERDIDNTLQVLQSSILRDSLVRKYDLRRHYAIDSTDPDQEFALIEAYNDNIGVERTRYGSILVAVRDTDPRLAAALANDIVRLGDQVKTTILGRNLRTAYQTVSRELALKRDELTLLADSINHLKRRNYHDALGLRGRHYARKQQQVEALRADLDRVRTAHNIYDLDKQYDVTYEAYMAAVTHYLTDSGMVAVMSQRLSATDTALIRRQAALAGGRILVRDLQLRLRGLNGSGTRYNRLVDSYATEKSVLAGLQGDYEFTLSSFDKEYDNLQLTTLKTKYLAELDLYKSLKARYELALSGLADLGSASYIVSPAEVATRPVAPRRALIAALVGASLYLLTVLALVTFENRDAIRRALA